MQTEKPIEETLNHYFNEITSSKALTFEWFAQALLVIISDFIHGRIDEGELGSLLNATYTTRPEIARFHEDPYLSKNNEFLAWISELSDIAWLMNSPKYGHYKKKLFEKHKIFEEKYQKQT